MAYRVRGRGQFSTPVSRTGKQFIYGGRRVVISDPAFKLTWRGPEIVADIIDAVLEGLQKLSNEALAYMRSIVPVDTGNLRDSGYVVLTIEGTRIKLVIGNGAYYAIYVELGTRFHAAQPFIRPTFDYIISKLPQLLQNEAQRRRST